MRRNFLLVLFMGLTNTIFSQDLPNKIFFNHQGPKKNLLYSTFVGGLATPTPSTQETETPTGALTPTTSTPTPTFTPNPSITDNAIFFPDKGTTKNIFAQEGDQALGNFVFQAADAPGNNAASYTEAKSGYFLIFRYGIGSVISKSDSVTTAAQQSLGLGGGSVSVNLAYPLFYYSSDVLMTEFLFSPRGGADVPVLGAETSDYTAHGDAGIQGLVSLNSDDNGFGLFGGLRYGVVGGSKLFYGNLGIPENVFAYWQYTVGLKLFTNFCVVWKGYIPLGVNLGPQTFGLQVCPSF